MQLENSASVSGTIELDGPEYKFRESEQRFRDLFESAPIACHELDEHGLVVRVNSTECELLGFRPEEMIGRPVWEFMAPDDRERSYESLRRKLSDQEELACLERQYTRRDGSTVILEIHPKLIRS